MSKKTIFFTMIACLTWGPLGLAEKAHAAPSTVESSKTITINNTKIDRKFIGIMEGSKLQGYVPLVRTTQSGVTIAHGFDLGQLSLREFNSMAIDKDLKDKLRPYVGLKKYKALSFLQRHPLSIMPKDMEQLNVASADSVLVPLVKYYNKDSGKSFMDMPPAAQTALFSFAYQYGPYFKSQALNQRELWHYFVKQDWPMASKQLRKFTTYASRRKSEAELLDRFT